jgi:CBS-domain-containing membrane protein
VIGGHLISTFVALAVFHLLGSTPLALGLGVASLREGSPPALAKERTHTQCRRRMPHPVN